MISFLKNSQNIGKKLVIFAFVSVIFTSVFCVVTWPWIKNFTVAIPGMAEEFDPEEGINYSDTFQYLGKFRAFQDKSLNWKLFNLSSRSNLAICQLTFGEMPGYNLWWFGSFLIAFLGGFALVKYLTKNSWAAFGAGLFFSLFSYHFAQSYGHSGAIWYGWLAFLTLFSIRYLNRKSRLDLIGTVFSLFLSVQADLHYALYSVLLVLAIVIYGFVSKKMAVKQFLKWPIIIAFVGTIMLLLFVFQSELKVYFSENNWMLPPGEFVADNSIDIFAPFTLPSYHILSGNVPLHSLESDNQKAFLERTIYLGWTIIAISFLGIWYYKKKGELKKTWFWIILAFGAMILALGIFLTFDVQTFSAIPLPYYLLFRYVPLFNVIRATGRIVVLSAIGWSVLVGFGLNSLTFLIRKEFLKKLIFFGLILLIALDLAYFNLPVGQPQVPNFYIKTLATDHSNSAILEIPASTDYTLASQTNYFATLNTHPKINLKDFARAGMVDVSEIINNPLLNKLAYEIPGNDEQNVIEQDWSRLGPDTFREKNIGYVTLHLPYLTDEALLREKELIQKSDCQLIYEDEKLLAYKTPTTDRPSVSYLMTQESWPENVSAIKTIKIHNTASENHTVMISFTGQSTSFRAQQLLFKYQDRVVQKIDLSGFEKFSTELDLLALPNESQLFIKSMAVDSQENITAPTVEFIDITYQFVD